MVNSAKIIMKFPLDIYEVFVIYLRGPIGYKLRYRYWKKRLKYIGKNVVIEDGVYFQKPRSISLDDNCLIDKGVIILGGPDKSNRARRYIPNKMFPLGRGGVHIGKNVHIAPYCLISGIGGIYISDNCTLSSGVKAYSLSHHYRSDEFPNIRSFGFGSCIRPENQFMIEGPIFIDKNVGVALNSIIMPGVVIKNDSFIAINSVVSSSFEENSLIAGNPAKRVKERYR